MPQYILYGTKVTHMILADLLWLYIYVKWTSSPEGNPYIVIRHCDKDWELLRTAELEM